MRFTELSIICPARNEEGNITGLIDEVEAALSSSGVAFELLVVDDGSTDATCTSVTACLASRPWLRALRVLGRSEVHGCGKSAALRVGLQCAAGNYIAFMDADGQNDPRDIVQMLQRLRATGYSMVQGNRTGHRRDNWVRKLSSKMAWLFRQVVLRDGIRDSGCGFQVMTRELANALPLQFTGMHRFVPNYARLAGYSVLEVPVHHRPRIAGRPKYGIRNRAIRSVIDTLVLLWMSRRFNSVRWEEVSLKSCGRSTGAIQSGTSESAVAIHNNKTEISS